MFRYDAHDLRPHFRRDLTCLFSGLLGVALFASTLTTRAQAEQPAGSPAPALAASAQAANQPLNEELKKTCIESLKEFPGGTSDQAKLALACAEAEWLTGCLSNEGKKIFHVDKKGLPAPGHKSQRILTLALIHGDETPSGSVARAWMERLAEISSRNDWRVIPIMNPDGVAKKTRTNGRGVDVNRNFPTENWENEALKAWEKLAASNPRRYPGASPASEVETKCAIAHIKDFKPDFIISVHTPLGVLDFDGPRQLPFPKFNPLPWRSLGHFPGSLGRYMWKEHGVPVLTVELKGDQVVRRSFEEFDRLQDITGTVAIQAQKAIDKAGVERKEVNYEPTMSQVPSDPKSTPN